MNKQLLKWIRFIAAFIAIVFFLIGLKQLLDLRQAGSEYETIFSSEMMGETFSETSQTDISTNATETDITETTNKSEITSTVPLYTTSEDIRVIDFQALQERNSDVYAWIEVPGTNVDYPILQHETDNSYYLTHTIDHEKTVAAAIYTENYNSKSFDDLHTVIYGHNMKNRTMFRTLHNYEDYDFFQENRDVIIYLPGETRYYKVFAAYTYDNRHLLFSFDWSNSESFQNYIDEIMSIKDFDAYIDKEMNITGEDNIITLSTCVNSGDSTKRYLVQAVLVSIQNNN